MTTIYLDIETLPSGDGPLSFTGDVKTANPTPEQIAEAYAKTAVDTQHAYVLCVGMAVGDGEPEVIWHVDGESLTLHTFALRLGDHKNPVIVTHNGHEFDLPCLARRMAYHQHHDPVVFNPAIKAIWRDKPWNDHRFTDTMKAWLGPTGFKGFTGPGRASLDGLARHLGIRREDNPIDGSEVRDAYANGKHDEIRAHVIDDVITLRKIHIQLSQMGIC